MSLSLEITRFQDFKISRCQDFKFFYEPRNSESYSSSCFVASQLRSLVDEIGIFEISLIDIAFFQLGLGLGNLGLGNLGSVVSG